MQTGEMLPLLERHKIQVLLKAGFSVKATATEAGASVDTVRRVRAEEAVTPVDEEQHRRNRGVGRPPKTRARSAVLSWLAEAPELSTQEILRRARETGAARFPAHDDWQKRRCGDATLTPEHRTPPREGRSVYAVPLRDDVEVGASFDSGDEVFPKGAGAPVQARSSRRARLGR